MDTTRGPAHRRRALAGAIGVGLAWALATAAGVQAADALSPPPPAFETCHASGGQTICHGTIAFPATGEPTGIWCGEGQDAFEIVDDPGSVAERATRWYDASGLLVRRMIGDVWLDSAWINPGSGARVAYRQSNVTIDSFAAPADFGSVTSTTTGTVTFLVPGAGAIVRNSGRVVFGADGELDFRSGPQAILDYFLDGDVSALQPICDALGG